MRHLTKEEMELSEKLRDKNISEEEREKIIERLREIADEENMGTSIMF